MEFPLLLVLLGLGLASSGSSFSLCIEEDRGDRKAKVVLRREAPGGEVISRRRRVDGLPVFLLEQNKHKPVDTYVWPWYLITHYLPSCQNTIQQNKEKSSTAALSSFSK